MTQVAVVGSVNLDIVVTADRRPKPGETVLGTGYAEASGGKGANQAIAAVRVTSTALVGETGKDAAATRLCNDLAAAGVNIVHLRRGVLPTGRAFISVTPDGENSITVLPMANRELTATRVTQALDELDPQLVLAQCEVPPPAVGAAAEWAEAHHRRFVLNPSPVGDLPEHVIRLADPLIVNEEEARFFAGFADDVELEETALHLSSRTRSLVVTAGSAGAWIVENAVPRLLASRAVMAVDTTGAGDAFAGTLAAYLVQGCSLHEAASHANEAAAELVQQARSNRN